MLNPVVGDVKVPVLVNTPSLKGCLLAANKIIILALPLINLQIRASGSVPPFIAKFDPHMIE